MTLLTALLTVTLTALWLVVARRYRVAPPRCAVVQTGAAMLALSLAFDASAAGAAHGSDHYLEVHAPAAWAAASSAFDGWMV